LRRGELEFCRKAPPDSKMNREYPECPLVGVGAIIVHRGQVVLVKRGRAPLLGEWSIPGGLLETGETLRQGAEREAREETGLVVRATELLGVFERLAPDADKRTRYHYVLIDFLCEVISGKLKASEDADDARWFSAEDIKGLPLPEDTAAVICTALAKVAQASSEASSQ
jgi:8-oxo-dGTP diphosphatase